MKFINLQPRLKAALNEDGAFRDITTLQIPGLAKQKSKAVILLKSRGVFCGGFLISTILKLLDPTAKVQLLKKDGQKVDRGQIAARITAKTKAVLGGERLILNLITHLSGIATLTHQFRLAVQGTSAAILDTRKTTPLWRDLEKYAVNCGGGKNHRFSLEDAILVKDNHLKYLKNRKIEPHQVYSPKALKKIRGKLKFVCMEATTYKEVWEAIKSHADIILLDNMPLNRIKGALLLIKATRKAFHSDTPLSEVSGGVSLANVRSYAALGVDRISIGALTHSAPALNISLEVE